MNIADFFAQFCLGRADEEKNIDGWSRHCLADWALFSHPGLPVVRVFLETGEPIGFLLGYPVSAEGEYLPESVSFPSDEVGSDRWVEKNLYKLGGRWLCLLATSGWRRLYLDPSGSLPAVYDSSRSNVASSASLIADALDDELIQHLQMPDSGLYFPFGNTAYRDVNRLLPNHYLDLDSMSPVRHWHIKLVSKAWTLDDAAHTMADVLRTTVEAVARKRKICVPLTGGRDSRMLMAACRNVLDAVEFITIVTSKTSVDVHLTAILRERFGINHRYIEIQKATPEELSRWQSDVGYCVGGRAWLDSASYREFDPGRVLMPSICGEIGRGFFYQRSDDPSQSLSPESLLLRMKIPANRQLLRQAGEYLDELASLGMDKFDMLDHAYNEQRLGSWASPTELGGDRFSSGKMWPLCNRRAIEMLHLTPVGFKRGDEVPRGVVNVLWSELNLVPYNKYTGISSFYMTADNFVRRLPKYVIDRLRARGFV